MSEAVTTDYRISPSVKARLIGAYLIIFAVAMLLVTAVVAVAGLTPDVIVLALAVGLLGLIANAWWLQSRLVVVRLTESGYRVRMVRAVGVAEARWSDVEDAVASSPRNIDCVVLRLKDGGSTTIPVDLIGADKDDFARDVRRHLQAAAG